MKRLHVMALLLAMPMLAQAQFKQPASPVQTRPVSLPPPSDTSPARAGEHDQRSARQQSSAAGAAEVSTPTPISRPVAQRPVYDAHGQRVSGMRQVGANRVMDTRTGRYHDTVPSGDGQRIVDKHDDGR